MIMLRSVFRNTDRSKTLLSSRSPTIKYPIEGGSKALFPGFTTNTVLGKVTQLIGTIEAGKTTLLDVCRPCPCNSILEPLRRLDIILTRRQRTKIPLQQSLLLSPVRLVCLTLNLVLHRCRLRSSMLGTTTTTKMDI